VEFRTSSEIDQEQYDLKARRGDFRNIPDGQDGGSGNGGKQAL